MHVALEVHGGGGTENRLLEGKGHVKKELWLGQLKEILLLQIDQLQT